MDYVVVVLPYLLTIGLLVGAYFTGTSFKRNKLKQILQDEIETKHIALATFKSVPPDWNVESSRLVYGSIMVAADFFSSFLADLKSIFGGPVHIFEPLLDIARREAVLRMKREAMQQGFSVVINVRLETSEIGEGKNILGVEVISYGTAIKLGK